MKTGQVIILGISIVAAFLIFGIFFYAARGNQNTVSVVGAATKRFDSDIVKWRITLNRTSDIKELSTGYRLIQADLQVLKGLLKERNIDDKDISIQPIGTDPVYGPQGQTSNYNIRQSLFVVTANIAAVEELALNPAALLDKGVIMQNSNLEYLNSQLAEIKMALLSEATKDARKRAEEIAKNSGASLGTVTSLKAGVFQINEPYSNEVSDYGMYNTQTKTKDITVTVRASFIIK
ncbi:conserved hypothetical protein [Candidatus Zixiibacteriota bacterium]|nr:conserved hypothetical protein [candidate division Zixibacteria bacterium]